MYDVPPVAEPNKAPYEHRIQMPNQDVKYKKHHEKMDEFLGKITAVLTMDAWERGQENQLAELYDTISDLRNQIDEMYFSEYMEE